MESLGRDPSERLRDDGQYVGLKVPRRRRINCHCTARKFQLFRTLWNPLDTTYLCSVAFSPQAHRTWAQRAT